MNDPAKTSAPSPPTSWTAVPEHDSQGVDDLMSGLQFGASANLPPAADPDAEPMVVRSVRMPLILDRRLKVAAAARGVPVSQLLRQWAEVQLAELDNDQPISRADALRALAAIRPLDKATA